MWMAGRRTKAGTVFGETDDFAWNIVRDPVHIHDMQATILHLCGINHEALTYRYQGGNSASPTCTGTWSKVARVAGRSGRTRLYFPSRAEVLASPSHIMASSIIDPSRLERIEFSNDEIARYSRHLIMPEVTLEGQKRLKAASVLCIGAGGLGSPIALYLAAAGVGRMGIVDGDTVDFPISSGRSSTARKTSAGRS
jgi:hypothetical protein